jgi:hypothetical protein
MEQLQITVSFHSFYWSFLMDTSSQFSEESLFYWRNIALILSIVHYWAFPQPISTLSYTTFMVLNLLLWTLFMGGVLVSRMGGVQSKMTHVVVVQPHQLSQTSLLVPSSLSSKTHTQRCRRLLSPAAFHMKVLMKFSLTTCTHSRWGNGMQLVVTSE